MRHDSPVAGRKPLSPLRPEEPFVTLCKASESFPAARFHSTIWDLVNDAKGLDSPLARQALAELCQAYWYPLYAFLRRSGEPADRAEDLIQGFFAEILAGNFFKSVDR